MEHVALLLANGFEEVEAITPVDILRRAGIKVTTVSITNTTEVTGDHQIKVKADATFNEVDFDDITCIVLPGGVPGAKNLQQHQKLNEQLVRFANKGKLIGAICAAPMVPGSLGLTKNKKVTCYPGFEGHLKEAEYTGSEMVLDGKLLTAKAAGVAMSFALQLVELLAGKEKAKEVAAKIFVEY